MILTHGANSLSRGGGGQTANIGGREYRIVEMPDGNIWMAQNLDYKFDGCGIGGEGSPTTPNAWYYNNDETTYGWDGYNCGLLYNWHAAKLLNDNKETLIPGWHVATNAEWDALSTAVGGSSTAGRKLKAAEVSWTTGWNGTDDYGFSVLPAGYRMSGGFGAVGSEARFVTVTDVSSAGYYGRNFTTAASTSSSIANKDMAVYSLRLVKDAS